MTDLKKKLKAIISDQPSKWKEKAGERKNHPWLKAYSSQIARRILAVLEDENELNQTKLAQLLEVSPQQISKIVKGQENLTLETIYKLSKALEVELISFPAYKYSSPLPRTLSIQSTAATNKPVPTNFTRLNFSTGKPYRIVND